MPYVIAFVSSIFYGGADFLGGMASRRTATLTVVTLSQGVGLGVVLLAIPFFPGLRAAPFDVVWGAAAGLAGALGLALLYHALAIGTMSIVAPITAVFAALVPFTVGLLHGERPAPLAVIGVAAALVAILLVSQPPADAAPGPGQWKPILVAWLSGLFFGIFFVMLDAASEQANLWTLVTARIASLALLLPVALVRGIRPAKDSVRPIIAGGFLDMAATILYLLAVTRGLLSIVATLVSLYPATTVVLARMVYRERLGRRQQWGIACAIAAVPLLVAG